MCGKRLIVFVYGTLKTNQPNHYWLTNHANGVASLVGNGTTSDQYPLLIGTRYHIPFLLKLAGIGHKVNGEIYSIDEHMLGKLDELECHPDYYLREEIPIDCEDG